MKLEIYMKLWKVFSSKSNYCSYKWRYCNANNITLQGTKKIQLDFDEKPFLEMILGFMGSVYSEGTYKNVQTFDFSGNEKF